MAARLSRQFVVVCLLAGSTIVSHPALSAQEAGSVPSAAGSGLWWTASAAVQGSRLTCDLCETGRDLGPALGVGVGAHASPNVRVGLDGSFATTTDDGARESIYGAGVVAALHPRPGSGLHLIGGLGWTGYRAGDFSYDAVRLRLGVGWDLPLAGSWVVGNRLTYDASGFASLRTDGEPVLESVGLGTAQFGMYIGRR